MSFHPAVLYIHKENSHGVVSHTSVIRHSKRVLVSFQPSGCKESAPPKTVTRLLALPLQLSPPHLLCLPLDLGPQFYLKKNISQNIVEMMAPASNYKSLSLEEPAAWLRNASLRRAHEVMCQSLSPSQLHAEGETLPQQRHPSLGRLHGMVRG